MFLRCLSQPSMHSVLLPSDSQCCCSCCCCWGCQASGGCWSTEHRSTTHRPHSPPSGIPAWKISNLDALHIRCTQSEKASTGGKLERHMSGIQRWDCLYIAVMAHWFWKLVYKKTMCFNILYEQPSTKPADETSKTSLKVNTLGFLLFKSRAFSPPFSICWNGLWAALPSPMHLVLSLCVMSGLILVSLSSLLSYPQRGFTPPVFLCFLIVFSVLLVLFPMVSSGFFVCLDAFFFFFSPFQLYVINAHLLFFNPSDLWSRVTGMRISDLTCYLMKRTAEGSTEGG